MKQKYINEILDADLILIGIGKEFETKKYCSEKRSIDALRELKKQIQDKNYFVITVCTNSILKRAGFPEERIVCPCGNVEWKQCAKKCEGSLKELTQEDKRILEEFLSKNEEPVLGKCPICGEDMVLNNVYASQYDENGYLGSWKMYTKWLQGTLNKKLCILELGMDLTFPSIIRWPFEKVAYYNQKSVFYRVNAELYHMTEELKEKGISIAENSIDWLLENDI